MYWLTILLVSKQFINLNSSSDIWCILSNLRLKRMHFFFALFIFNKHARYVTCRCCFIFIRLYLIFSWRKFYDLRLLAKIIDLVLPSPKCIHSLLSTNQLQIYSKSLLNCFSITSTFSCWYKMHESFAYKKSIVDYLWHRSKNIDQKQKGT